MLGWIRFNEGVIILLALIVAFASFTVIEARLKAKQETYQSNTPLTRQISYCYVYRTYTVKHGKYRGERWFKDSYLPCYFIPFRERV